MTKINMCFEHQVAVKVFFVNNDASSVTPIIKYLKSDPEGILEIPLEGIDDGKWKLTLEWNYEGKDYLLVRQITIPYQTSASA